ncbi:MAG: orotate phosphoribosyltransferase [Actinomycetota bacterium]|nr:orotate phosphoribosyltransferase [Actinomycetota bacterium]
MTPEQVSVLLEDSGALLKGHFRLSSGRHSDFYVQKFRVFERPEATRALGAALADLFDDFAAVASPALGAVVLGFSVALAGGARSVFAERVEGELKLRRGFSLGTGERVLVVEDVVTTGGSAREVVELAQQWGAEVVGVGALLDRSEGEVGLGAPLSSLLRLEASSWEPAACPLCRAGAPLEDPGSRRSRP